MNDWHAQVLRYTVFLGELQDFEVNPDDWWRYTVGEPPDDIQFQPKMQKYQASAIYAGGTLSLRLEGNRIEWILKATEKTNVSDSDIENKFGIATIPLIGSYPETRDTFVDIVLKWLTSPAVPRVQRVAYGAILVIPETDRIAGYKKLDILLQDVKIDSEGSSDFQYSINRPRSLKIGDETIKVNRLSKWGVAQVMTQQLQILPLLRRQGSAITEAIGTRVELDINTDPMYEGEFDAVQQVNIFNALVTLGNEIAEKGDIK